MSRLRTGLRWISAAAAAALSLAVRGEACAETDQQALMKVCAAEWSSLKAANQTAGKVYQDFIRECLARHRATTKPDGRS